MKYFLFSVKDVLSGNLTTIELFPNKEVAVRWFNGLCQESKIKDDLQLFCLGCYDTKTGEIFSDVEFIKAGADYEKN